MLSTITVFLYALTLGILHAFEADHVAAVATFSGKTDGVKKTSRLGMMWGFGHATTLFVVGTILLSLGAVIPVAVSSTLEGIVGIMLVILGISVFLKVKRDRLHLHSHIHEGESHAHIHSHKESPNHNHEHKSFLVGLVHGLAGSGALLLVVLATAESVLQGVFFIAVFGVGSIFGMMIVTILLGYVLSKINKFQKVRELTQIIAGSFSVFIGIVLISESFFI